MSGKSGLDGRTILIIDDEPVFRQQLNALLTQQGVQVVEADNGEQGLQQLGECLPDLILCDIMMPQINGIEFLKTLMERGISTPVVIISGQNDMQRVDEALKRGASDYLFKPLRDLDALYFTLSSNMANLDADAADSAKLIQSELTEHLGHFRANDLAATRLMSDLLPETPQLINGYHISYRRVGAHIVPEFLPLSGGRLALMAFDLSALGQDAAVAGIIVKSLINEGYRRYCNGRDDTISRPDKFCASLNRQLWRAQIKASVPFFHMVTDEAGLQVECCNAGFVVCSGHIETLNETGVDSALGQNDASRYHKRTMQVTDHLIAIGLGNLFGEQLFLKLNQI